MPKTGYEEDGFPAQKLELLRGGIPLSFHVSITRTGLVRVSAGAHAHRSVLAEIV